MRIFASITAVLLFLFLLNSAPAFSQESIDRPDHPQDQKAKDKDKDKDRAGPKQNDDSRHDARQQENREHPEAARPQEQTRPEERRDEHAGRPQEQTRPEGQARQENRDEQRQHVAGEQGHGQHRGQRIPEEKFRVSFGREHHFHVERARIINQSQPQFVYSGYTFELANPWPAEWAFDDDCYIEYVDDDYYLIDTFHPGIRILVFVIG
jgi:DNA mismatch repair ATPase MutL